MKNSYILTCNAIDYDGNKWQIYGATFTNKVLATKKYDEMSHKRYVQEIFLYNVTTGELVRSMLTGNVVTGRRTFRPIILR